VKVKATLNLGYRDYPKLEPPFLQDEVRDVEDALGELLIKRGHAVAVLAEQKKDGTATDGKAESDAASKKAKQ
jgi:hypothetical protein